MRQNTELVHLDPPGEVCLKPSRSPAVASRNEGQKKGTTETTVTGVNEVRSDASTDGKRLSSKSPAAFSHSLTLRLACVWIRGLQTNSCTCAIQNQPMAKDVEIADIANVRRVLSMGLAKLPVHSVVRV